MRGLGASAKGRGVSADITLTSSGSGGFSLGPLPANSAASNRRRPLGLGLGSGIVVAVCILVAMMLLLMIYEPQLLPSDPPPYSSSSSPSHSLADGEVSDANPTPPLNSSSSPLCSTSPYIPPIKNVGPPCPKWFSGIVSDLHPWRKKGGIDVNDVAAAQLASQMRLKIVDGRLYGHISVFCYFTRTHYTLWGFIQLLKRFPGQIPDVDLMFSCYDLPFILDPVYGHLESLPIQFRYSKWDDPKWLDLLWPDWSFWGWAETKMEEWETLSEKIRNGEQGRKPWEERKPLAFWKGNTDTRPDVREPVVACNDEPNHKWGVEAYNIKWDTDAGKDETLLERQCDYRYKIYCEGGAWSASLKYILACGSTVIFVRPYHKEFFARGIVQGEHYLQVPHPSQGNVCEALHKTITEGNNNVTEMKRIAENARRFVEEEINMDRIYDYMLHFLREYAKLQRFQPTVVNSGFLEITEKFVIEKTPENLRSYFKPLDPSKVNSPVCLFE